MGWFFVFYVFCICAQHNAQNINERQSVKVKSAHSSKTLIEHSIGSSELKKARGKVQLKVKPLDSVFVEYADTSIQHKAKKDSGQANIEEPKLDSVFVEYRETPNATQSDIDMSPELRTNVDRLLMIAENAEKAAEDAVALTHMDPDEFPNLDVMLLARSAESLAKNALRAARDAHESRNKARAKLEDDKKIEKLHALDKSLQNVANTKNKVEKLHTLDKPVQFLGETDKKAEQLHASVKIVSPENAPASGVFAKKHQVAFSKNNRVANVFKQEQVRLQKEQKATGTTGILLAEEPKTHNVASALKKIRKNKRKNKKHQAAAGSVAHKPALIQIPEIDEVDKRSDDSSTISPDNVAPVRLGSLSNQFAKVGQPFFLSLKTLFKDTDGDNLVFDAKNLPEGISLKGNVLKGIAKKRGNYATKISVTDGIHSVWAPPFWIYAS